MDEIKTVHLPYGGSEYIDVHIPVKNFAGAYSSRETSSAVNTEEMVKTLLSAPTGTPPFALMAKKAKHVLFVVDDNTRRTPVKDILQVALQILKQYRFDNSNIKILFASGTHRAMTGEEEVLKVGKEVTERFECTCHDYMGKMVSFGSTKYGTPVEMNPLLAWSDLTVAIGSIIPHAYCGWGGGGKMLLPGASSAKSILATHMLPYEDPKIGIGVIENRARTEIDEGSRMAGLKFIINTILDSRGNIVTAVAGDPVKAHREGIKKAIEVQGVEMPEADLVFGCAYPECNNYWQAAKALHPMAAAVKKGGLAVMVANMPEGRGEHMACFDAMGQTEKEVVDHLNSVRESDFDEAIALACALADRKLQNRARAGIVSSGLPFDDNAGGTFKRYRTPDEAVAQALRENPQAKITCLLNAPEMLPIIRK